MADLNNREERKQDKAERKQDKADLLSEIETLMVPLKAHKLSITEFSILVVIFTLLAFISLGVLMNRSKTTAIQVMLVKKDTADAHFQSLVLSEFKVLLKSDADLKAQQNHIPSYPLRAADLTRITSRYDFRKNPFDSVTEFHSRIDLAAKRGSPVYAPAEGIVIQANFDDGWGNVVGINHDGNGYITYCSHLDSIKVKVGQRVMKGDLIGTVGRTGEATGTHVDFRVAFNGVFVNPEIINYLTN